MMHLHRYGGRVMCGRAVESVEHTDNVLTFDAAPDACRVCERAKVADDDRELAEWRAAYPEEP